MANVFTFFFNLEAIIGSEFVGTWKVNFLTSSSTAIYQFVVRNSKVHVLVIDCSWKNCKGNTDVEILESPWSGLPASEGWRRATSIHYRRNADIYFKLQGDKLIAKYFYIYPGGSCREGCPMEGTRGESNGEMQKRYHSPEREWGGRRS